MHPLYIKFLDITIPRRLKYLWKTTMNIHYLWGKRGVLLVLCRIWSAGWYPSKVSSYLRHSWIWFSSWYSSKASGYHRLLLSWFLLLSLKMWMWKRMGSLWQFWRKGWRRENPSLGHDNPIWKDECDGKDSSNHCTA